VDPIVERRALDFRGDQPGCGSIVWSCERSR
jgi:hypothetical protein